MFTKEAASMLKNPYVLIWEREGPQGNKWNVMEKSLLGAMIKVCWAGRFLLLSFLPLAVYLQTLRFGISDQIYIEPAYLALRPTLDHRPLTIPILLMVLF